MAKTQWERVVEATDVHNIDTVTVHVGEGQSWTYIRCTCGNKPNEEAFSEPWEFTDHIRRIVFAAMTSDD